MDLKNVVVAHFSPTGGTKRVAMAIEGGLLECHRELELNVTTYNFLSERNREQRVPKFGPNDLLIFTYPVFYGRMPWAFAQWPELQGNGAAAVVVSVYGNRAIEDAERETMAFLTDHGFKVIGRIEAIAEHSNERSLAQDRPNATDKEELRSFARAIVNTIKNCTATHEVSALEFDRTTPLKEYGKAPGVPLLLDEAREKCTTCGRCATICPCGIINPVDLTVHEEDKHKCMACRACMNACRAGGRDFAPEVKEGIKARMAVIKANNLEPKPNVFELGAIK